MEDHILFILYKLQVIKMFLSSSQHFDKISLCVILDPNILRECIALEQDYFLGVHVNNLKKLVPLDELLIQ